MKDVDEVLKAPPYRGPIVLKMSVEERNAQRVREACERWLRDDDAPAVTLHEGDSVVVRSKSDLDAEIVTLQARIAELEGADEARRQTQRERVARSRLKDVDG